MADPGFGPTTALLVVDVQHDFADPAGSLAVAGGEEVAAVANRYMRAALAAGSPVFYTQDWHPPDTPHFAKDGGTWPVHCVGDTWGAQPADDLIVSGPVIRKGTGGEDGYSGFTVRDPMTGERGPTDLERLLREGGVSRIVIAGIATDYCVKETALDGLRLGFDVAIATDAVRAVDLEPGDGDRALAAMRAAGATLLD